MIVSISFGHQINFRKLHSLSSDGQTRKTEYSSPSGHDAPNEPIGHNGHNGSDGHNGPNGQNVSSGAQFDF
jgi:hypothetical protein